MFMAFSITRPLGSLTFLFKHACICYYSFVTSAIMKIKAWPEFVFLFFVFGWNWLYQ